MTGVFFQDDVSGLAARQVPVCGFFFGFCCQPFRLASLCSAIHLPLEREGISFV